MGHLGRDVSIHNSAPGARQGISYMYSPFINDALFTMCSNFDSFVTFYHFHVTRVCIIYHNFPSILNCIRLL